jgi:hypothetical protein
VLSEDAKSRNLKQRIIDAARNERNGLLIIPMGVFLVSAGLIVSVVGNTSVAYFGGIFFVESGILSTMFGFYVSVHYAHQYSNLLKELDAVQSAKEVEK